MKKYYLLLLGIISGFSLFAQSKAISYQAVIMDPNQIEIPGQNIVGQPLSNGSVCLKFTVLNADGSIDYEETQSTQTDEFGLVSLSIGSSTTTNNQSKRTVLSTGKYADFSSMKWDANRKALKVSVSFDNCSTYKVSSVELLNYTPYSMYAAAVDYKNVDGAPTNLSQFKNDSGFILPKDLDPIQANITNLSDKTDSKFLVVNQQIAVLDSTNKNTNLKFAAIDTTLSGYNTRLTTNETTIKQTNNYVNQQVGGLQTQINTTNTTINQLGVTYEVVSNKSTDTALGSSSPSNELYPSQLAVKSYVDQSIQDAVASGAPDATTLAKGKVKLAGDLGGTADLPTVPALSLKESLSNKSTSVSTDGTSNTKYPSAKAVKDYVDAAVSGVAFQTNLDAKADKDSPTFTGTPVLPTGTTGVTQTNTDNSTKLATTAFVQAALSAGVIDATTSAKGKIKLAGDLGGTADLPTVPGLANKEDVSNKSDNTSLGTSTSLYPTQNAVKIYVDNQVTNASIADATTLVKGKIQLAGDLGGTAASPTVPGLANKENTITAGTTSQYYRGDKSWQTLDKSAVGLGNVDNTSDAGKPISTATQTALDLKAPLASAALTGTPTAPTATAGTNTTQLATTEFVTSALTSVSISDATTLVKGKIQLAGDLGGTAASPTVPGLANKENTITAGTTSQYYRGDKSWQTLDKSAVGLGNVDNTSDAGKPISTATQTALDLKAPLASAALTGTPTAPTATAGTNTTQIATTEFVTSAVSTGVASGITIGSVESSSTAKGATITSGVIKLAPADGTNPGILTTGAQTISGSKTFSSGIIGSISGNAATVTTNADLTGPITSVGNTTSVASQTGTGSKFVMDTSPTLVTPTLGVASATSINGLTPTAQTIGFTIAGGTTSKTLTVSGNADVSGTNTGDQTITLTGDVTGTGNGSFATTIANNAVETAKIKDANVTNAKLDKTNIPLSGFGAATADVALGSNKLTGVADPTLAQDAATKNYVDNATSDINTLADGKIYLGNASNEATEVTMSGDVTISNAGVSTIGASKVSYAKMQNVSASDKVLGRVSANAGVIEEISTTGSGDVVRATSPTLVTPSLGVATATSINKITLTAPATSATITVADGKTLSVTNDATVSGTNTGDQTITLTGDVTGTGNGSFATTIGAGKVTSSMLASDAIVDKSDEITATAGQDSFTITHAKGTNKTIKMYINGIRVSNNAYSDSGTTINYTKINNGNYTIAAGDRVQFDYSY